MNALVNDIRYLLAKKPGFTLVAVVTLGLISPLQGVTTRLEAGIRYAR